MKASRIVHNNENRIKVEFPFNQKTISMLRRIRDAHWSKTHGAWHIPDNNEAIKQLISLFPDIEIHTPEKVVVRPPEPPSAIDKSEIVVVVSGKTITLKMPKNETDIQFVRTFKYVRWDNSHFTWIIPNYRQNLELLKNYFNSRITSIKTIPVQTAFEQSRIDAIAHPDEIVTNLPKIDSESLQEIEQF